MSDSFYPGPSQSQFQIPNPAEKATLLTRFGESFTESTFASSRPSGQGQTSGSFDDWEQIYIKLTLFDNHGVFRFLAVERDPIPTLWQRLQFQPGDEVAIYLGGELAIVGPILIRQTAYDAVTHGVMLQGSTYSIYTSKVSVQGPESTGNMGSGGSGKDEGNFDNQNFQQIASTVLSKKGIPFQFLPGQIDPTPFKKLQAEMGEPIFQFLERIARPRGVVIGQNQQGAITFQGQTQFPVVDQLIEGQNILRMQAIWSVNENRSMVGATGQTAGSDDKQGTDASEQTAWTNGRDIKYSPWLTVAEQPVWNLAELQQRARNEARWLNSDTLTVNATVQGWKRGDGRLWRLNDMVYVDSPMAMLHDVLGVQSVTYQQDSASGTTTTLELVLPWRLGNGDHAGQGGDNPLTSDPNNPNEPTFGSYTPGTDTSTPPSAPDFLPGSEPTFGQIPGPPADVNPPFGGT